MRSTLFFMVAVSVILFISSDPAIAGPGGKIASAVFDTFWGKVLLGILTIVFLPLITYNYIREKFAERRARKDLRFMAQYSPVFDWLKIQERLKDCFYRVHSGWKEEDLSGVSSWMTDWYWQNQQAVYLDKWKKEGLVNICNIKKILDIKPLLFVHRNQGSEHEDSMLVLSVNAKMNDYLQNAYTKKIIEGSKIYKSVETIWSLTLINGVWKVSDIEEAAMSFAYIKMTKELPAIESTVISDFRA